MAALTHYVRGGKFIRAGVVTLRAWGYAWCNGRQTLGSRTLGGVNCERCRRIALASTEER